MAEKQRQFINLSAKAAMLVKQACEAHGCKPDDVLEAAVLAYLDPQDLTERDTVLAQSQMALGKDVRSMLPLLKKMVEHLAAQATPPPIQVASYEQMYAEADEAEAEETPQPELPPAPAKPGWWGRAFPKRGN